jgi:hypothetical protein
MTRRILGIVVLVLSLIVLLAPTINTQSTTCCQTCLQRFQQCDANNIVCCKIYNSCIAQCPNACQSCPDK